MRNSLIAIAIAATSCGGKSSKNAEDTPTNPNNNPPVQTPVTGDEPSNKDPLVYDYNPSWASPMYVAASGFRESKTKYVDDLLTHLKTFLSVWGTSKKVSHIPTEYLSQWNGDIEYVDDTNGEVKGIEKLEPIYQKMLEKCPVLSLPEHNSPVTVFWDQGIDDTTGLYTYNKITLGEFIHADASKEMRYTGAILPNVASSIRVYGKNDAWDYPNQTTEESGNPYGIDWTFVHEWGHHLKTSIDINLGRMSYRTYELAENFAKSIEAVCGGSHLDLPDIVDSIYENRLSTNDNIQLWSDILRDVTDAFPGAQYALRSMESCIVHEKYLGRFDSNTFASALIEAYKRTTGRLLDPNPYPLKFSDGTSANGGWVEFSLITPTSAAKTQPMMSTRAEFLDRFLEVYDCGAANEHIRADMESKLKFEW